VERMVGVWNGLSGHGMDREDLERMVGGETDGGGVEQIVGGWNRWWGGGGAHCYAVVTFIVVCWWAVVMGSCCPPVGGLGICPSSCLFVIAVVSANSMAGQCGTSRWTVDVPHRCHSGRLWGSWGGCLLWVVRVVC
jgi:hypothetical protein